MLTKQEIIKKLQKFAKENGGKTPSEKVLFENTNIGIMGRRRYWSNYGELVLEAGLTPNKFDKTKYSHTQLCNMFIKAIREKGKWPTRGILDVKHHNDRSFPDSTTFYSKLGLTSELAKTILEYTSDKHGYKDVVNICNSIILKSGDKLPLEDENATTGYIYLGKQHGSYKIGKSKDPNRRREDISLLGPEPFEIIHEIKTDDMNGVEKYWHERFNSKHKRGEWFNLSKADVAAFKRWKKIA